jgi:ABC-type oligopeptide transport system substrate-binding subunit
MSSKRWGSTEKMKLMKLYAESKSYDDIGIALNRSSNAIKLRLEAIVYDNLTKGKSISILSRMLNASNDTIKQLYYSHKSFKESRGKNVIDVDFSSSPIQSLDKLTNNNSDTHSIVNTNKSKKTSQHLQKIEQENQILEAIIKNYRMKRHLRKLYVDGKLDKKSLSMYNQIIKK